MAEWLLVAKIVVTAGVVIVLSVLAERAGPRIAGVLAGLPLGTAIVYFFIGLEQGPAFVTAAAPHTLGGLIATLAFAYAYWQGSRRGGRSSVLLGSLTALPAFAVTAWLLSLPDLGFGVEAALAILTIVVAMAAMHAIPEQAMTRRLRLTPVMLVLRAATATAVVLLVTGLAGLIGPRWAGLLSGFPMTFYPLLLVIHIGYSAQHAHGLLRNFPFGLGAVTGFVCSARFTFEPLGVVGGTAASMAAGLAYLLGYWTIARLLRRRAAAG